MAADARTEASACVLSYYDCVDAGDVEGLIALFTPDSVYRRPGYAPLSGHAELRHFYEEVRVIESGRHEVAQIVVELPSVVVVGDFAGRLRDGSDSTARFCDVFELTADHRIARRETFFSAPLV